MVLVPAFVEKAAAWFFCNEDEIPEADRAAVRDALGRHLDGLDLAAPWGAVKSAATYIDTIERLIPHLDPERLDGLRASLSVHERTRADDPPFAWLDVEREPDRKEFTGDDVAALFGWLDTI